MISRSMQCGAVAAAVIVVGLSVSACGAKKAPVARPVAPVEQPVAQEPAPPPPPPPKPVAVNEPGLNTATLSDDPLTAKSLDDLNRESPLQPAFFEYDSSELTPAARTVLDADAATLKKYASWIITVEGHCDERGTAEYNTALGERRAAAARAYLVSLGVPADRLHVVSYGKEFPFDPAHTEAAYAANRRAHLVITAK